MLERGGDRSGGGRHLYGAPGRAAAGRPDPDPGRAAQRVDAAIAGCEINDRGRRSPPVQRHRGVVARCQVAVTLTYAADRGLRGGGARDGHLRRDAGDEAGRRPTAVGLCSPRLRAATQEQVAAAFGVIPVTVWRWVRALERGEVARGWSRWQGAAAGVGAGGGGGCPDTGRTDATIGGNLRRGC